jgi:hypothetical protein
VGTLSATFFSIFVAVPLLGPRTRNSRGLSHPGAAAG